MVSPGSLLVYIYSTYFILAMTISSESTPSTTMTRSVKDHEGPSNNDSYHMPTLPTPTPPHFNQPQATQCVKMAMAAVAVAGSRHNTFGATGIFFPPFSLSSFLYITLRVLRVIKESTGAALTYILDNSNNSVIALYE